VEGPAARPRGGRGAAAGIGEPNESERKGGGGGGGDDMLPAMRGKARGAATGRGGHEPRPAREGECGRRRRRQRGHATCARGGETGSEAGRGEPYVTTQILNARD
jgi:hypothetical protein